MLWIALSSPENQLCHFCLDWYCLQPVEVICTSQMKWLTRRSSCQITGRRNTARDYGSETHLDNPADG